jgi:hypothetical protein
MNSQTHNPDLCPPTPPVHARNIPASVQPASGERRHGPWGAVHSRCALPVRTAPDLSVRKVMHTSAPTLRAHHHASTATPATPCTALGPKRQLQPYHQDTPRLLLSPDPCRSPRPRHHAAVPRPLRGIPVGHLLPTPVLLACPPSPSPPTVPLQCRRPHRTA